MPVLINYKICDLAPECDGIEVCPKKAFFYNLKKKRPEVDNTKCISCGLCEKSCPVNAILVVKTWEEYKQFAEQIKEDPRTEEELWQERLGCQPGTTPPLAKIVTPINFSKEILDSEEIIVLDVWSLETLDCRYHSLSWRKINDQDAIQLKKLDGGKYPKLAKKLNIKIIPTLLFFKNGKEITRLEGYLYQEDQKKIKNILMKIKRNF